MRMRVVRLLLATITAVIALVALAIIVVYGTSELRLRKTYQVNVAAPPIPGDVASIERGRILAGPATHCVGCHTPNLGGQTLVDAPPFLVVAPNLTGGAGGVGASYGDADWVRAIRHGVRPDGTALHIMPSNNFQQLSNADVAAIIAYIKTVPSVDNQPGKSELRPLGRLLMLLNQYSLPAETIDHTATSPATVPFGRTAEYGRYLSVIGGCVSCHAANFSGAPGVIPGEPPAPNVTRGGELKNWSEADFIKAMRKGVRPNGSPINPAMPWELTGQLSDDELGALYLYLQSLPALPNNTPVE